jgi:copper chaperone
MIEGQRITIVTMLSDQGRGRKSSVYVNRCFGAVFAPDSQERSHTMPEPIKDLLMQVEGMSCQGCVEKVTRTVRELDPEAKVEADLEHGRLHVTTRAQSVEVAEALSAAGYEATAMTG